MQEKPYPGTYLHGININDWYPCWNLSLSGSLFSPDYVAQVDSAISQLHTSLCIFRSCHTPKTEYAAQ